MKNIIFLVFSISLSCLAQTKQKPVLQYTPIEISYKNGSLPYKKKANYFTIMNYTLVNPLIARQFYDKSQDEFSKLNTTISFSRDVCHSMVEKYVSNKTDSNYSGMFYNSFSNQNFSGTQLSKEIYSISFENEQIYYRCVCIPTSYLSLKKDYKEGLSEFNLPGGYVLESKEMNKLIINRLDSLDLNEVPFYNLYPFDISPSFDCSRARSLAEKVICRDVELSNLDRDLMYIYKKLVLLKGEKFREEQRLWIENRDKAIEKKTHSESIKFLRELYSNRIQELKL
ncbi:lysozyme inhibitor LprI family protein [Emticicia sp. SJ17W-69]|uniref:lysozyme inhibitor LprI family protein n=1 Tax=Emticicia sp. SJ17W-69 TaxID=3421657 RepID=UPI003EB8535C